MAAPWLVRCTKVSSVVSSVGGWGRVLRAPRASLSKDSMLSPQDPTMPVASRITMVTLGVANLAESRAFYERLGWKASEASNESVTFFHSGGTVLGLYGREALAKDAGIKAAGVEATSLDHGPASFTGVALATNYNSQAEVDAAFAYAVASGATPTKPPEKAFWGGYSGYYADPDGHLWEVAHNPMAPLDNAGHMTLE
ncbi:VOC family protein [Rubripirellula amarantea]|nr:VOC family protein [Rubripirellula amarantea]